MAGCAQRCKRYAKPHGGDDARPCARPFVGGCGWPPAGLALRGPRAHPVVEPARSSAETVRSEPDLVDRAMATSMRGVRASICAGHAAGATPRRVATRGLSSRSAIFRSWSVIGPRWSRASSRTVSDKRGSSSSPAAASRPRLPWRRIARLPAEQPWSVACAAAPAGRASATSRPEPAGWAVPGRTKRRVGRAGAVDLKRPLGEIDPVPPAQPAHPGWRRVSRRRAGASGSTLRLRGNDPSGARGDGERPPRARRGRRSPAPETRARARLRPRRARTGSARRGRSFDGRSRGPRAPRPPVPR